MSEIKPITPEEARNEAKRNIPEFICNIAQSNYMIYGYF